jgi:prepilin-type N-terminal cleavage/methylation domain-containing protein
MLKHPETRGFSLTELMIVVSVLSLLWAVIVPPMTSFVRSSRVIGAAETMISDIRSARSLATSERRTYRIELGTSEYRIVQISPPDTVRTRGLPSGVSCSTSDTLSFYPWGLTTPASITISGNGPSTTVQLSATGSATRD